LDEEHCSGGGLFARLINPHHLFIGGGREDLATLHHAIQEMLSTAAPRQPAEPERSVIVLLTLRLPGDFAELRVVLADSIESISPYREYGAGLPLKYRPLVEMDIERLTMPDVLQMTHATCDIAANACLWSGWILSGAAARDEEGLRSDSRLVTLPASTEPVCPRCGKQVRLSSSTSFIRDYDEEEADEERFADLVCIPYHYMGEKEEELEIDDAEPEGEEEADYEGSFPDNYFLTAFRESDERITIRGDRISLNVLADRCASRDPEDDDHDTIVLVAPDIPHFWKLRLDSKYGRDSREDVCLDSSWQGAACNKPDACSINKDFASPDLVSIRYGLCVREPCACEWQGWFLECTFHYADGVRPAPAERWRTVSDVSPEPLCPRCGRKLVDIASAMFKPGVWRDQEIEEK